MWLTWHKLKRHSASNCQLSTTIFFFVCVPVPFEITHALLIAMYLIAKNKAAFLAVLSQYQYSMSSKCLLFRMWIAKPLLTNGVSGWVKSEMHEMENDIKKIQKKCFVTQRVQQRISWNVTPLSRGIIVVHDY